MLVGDLTVDVRRSPTFWWWEKRRPLYNAGLLAAGILAFVAYAVVVIRYNDVINASDPSQADEFSGFTLAFQAIGFMCMMLVANVCFFLGPLSELWLRPRNVDRYRKFAFRLGFWCSIALPFGIPTFLFLVATFYPAYWQHASDAR